MNSQQKTVSKTVVNDIAFEHDEDWKEPTGFKWAKKVPSKPAKSETKQSDVDQKVQVQPSKLLDNKNCSNDAYYEDELDEEGEEYEEEYEESYEEEYEESYEEGEEEDEEYGEEGDEEYEEYEE